MKHRCIGLLAIVSLALTFLMPSCSMVDSPRMAAAADDHAIASRTGFSTEQGSLPKSSWPGDEFSRAEPSTGEGDWPMAAANPQRTSWTAEQVPSAEYLAAHRNEWNNGMLYPQWAKPIEPYIAHKIQVVAAYNTLYVASAKALYAFYASDPDGSGPLREGDTKWVYPTDLPLGHSPTVADGVAYLAGFDHKLHAIAANPNPSALPLDSRTGQRINDQVFWTFEADAGFQTNPLVANNLVYMGNRDGAFYAIYAQSHPDTAQRGKLAWKFETEGPILFSAAMDPAGSTLYFVSNDSYAYALNAHTGALVWKSVKLPGAGFHSWWPVVYQNTIILPGSQDYRDNLAPGPGRNLENLDRDDVFPNRMSDPRGTPVGPRQPNGWLDTSRPNTTPNGSTLSLSTYFENKPWRRTFFVLDRATGQEITYDFNGNEKREYAPVLWFGSQSGNRYPPIVGADGILYQTNCWMSGGYIDGGGVSGWRIGTPYLSTPSGYLQACDEPISVSAGGNIIYWAMHNDLAAGAFDISVPNTRFWDNGDPGLDPTREWAYWGYNLSDLLPGYDVAFGTNWSAFGGKNGVYGRNGDQPAAIPYRGKVYFIRGNALLAFGMEQGTPVVLPVAPTVAVDSESIRSDPDRLKQRLAAEVQKIVQAGHLRPGYLSSGHVDLQLKQDCSDNLQDYWHDPSDTVYTLLRALPHLPSNLQQQTKTYLQSEFAAYPPYEYSHSGWKDGATREAFELPPEVEADRINYPPSQWYGYGFAGWGGGYGGTGFPPHMFYTLWKYAQVFGNARTLFDASRTRLGAEPADTVLRQYPFVVNSFIAGYIGYLNLQEMAYDARDPAIQAKLDRLLQFRRDTFSADTPYVNGDYCRALSVSRNFLFLTPELGQYLHDQALTKVQNAVSEYYRVEPYWFVSAFEDTFGEAIIQPLYDVNALYSAKALILKEPREELVRYLDVPAFARGDLFYIQNLVATIEAAPVLEKTAVPRYGDQGAPIVYSLSFFGTGNPLALNDSLPLGMGPPGDYQLTGTNVVPAYDSGQHRLTWSDTPPVGQRVIIRYTSTITADHPVALVNTAELSEAGGEPTIVKAVVFANYYVSHLPLIAGGN